MEVNGGVGVEEWEPLAEPVWDETPAVAGVGSIQKRQQSAPPYYVFSSTLPLTNPTYLFCYPSSLLLFALNPPNPLPLLLLLLFQPSRHVRTSPLELSSHPSPLTPFFILPFMPSRKILATGSSALSTRGNWISVFFFLSLVLSLSLFVFLFPR